VKRAVLLTLLAAAAAVAVLLVVRYLERPPAGPLEPAWDRQTCAHCRMHLSERPFAAQAHTAAGEVLFFDDPGCLFAWEEAGGAAAAIWFHHLREERWLAGADSGFVAAAPTPMGWGLGAVDREETGAIPVDEARRRVRQRGMPAAPVEGGGDDGQPAH
jgi:hypothetical protein